MSGKELCSLMRIHQVTIKEMARRLGITQVRVRAVRREGIVNPWVKRDWLEALSGRPCAACRAAGASMMRVCVPCSECGRSQSMRWGEYLERFRVPRTGAAAYAPAYDALLCLQCRQETPVMDSPHADSPPPVKRLKRPAPTPKPPRRRL